jgi:hypothetical protein
VLRQWVVLLSQGLGSDPRLISGVSRLIDVGTLCRLRVRLRLWILPGLGSQQKGVGNVGLITYSLHAQVFTEEE